MIATSKVALVTGAATGIGRAIAIRLAKDGIAVAVNYIGNPALANEVVTEISEAGGTAEAFEANVGVVAEIIGLYDAVIEKFRGIDIVVANAGIAKMGVPIAEVTEEDFDKINAINHKGTYFLLQQAAKQEEMVAELFKFLQQVHSIHLQGLEFMHQAKPQEK